MIICNKCSVKMERGKITTIDSTLENSIALRVAYLRVDDGRSQPQ